ncbi:P-loop containing nucleoside triphosphate hydrolase protein [Pelagophyceae sp. CCMP2097]|nr:P-loop containing nucleoside triphosphate hydrolase protein [Pelagophyceae sp. CCMP2097]|mmetsp:Transcript_3984/g.12285  ORF Transcript_3984/g.12285 Transcript_3984/m.12285 type:complete len:513 (+) Transcript_3984:41-1579(+)
MATVLEARDVDFEYANARGFGLRGVNLSLQKGRCLALMGFNAQGKSTLCRVLADARLHVNDAAWAPARGAVWRYDGARGRHDVHGSTAASSVAAVAAVVVAAFGGATAATLGGGSGAELVANFARFSAALALACVLACVVLGSVLVEWARGYLRRRAHRKRVLYVSTEDDLAKHVLKDHWALEEAICGGTSLNRSDRRALAERLLSWAGFRMFRDEDGDSLEYGDATVYLADKNITCGTLSGGQRHLVYLLRALAVVYAPERGWFGQTRLEASPDLVLVLDEAFNCLDAHVRPRVLRLVRHAVTSRGVSAVVVTQVMHEIAAVCDDAAFVHDGAIVERLPAASLIRGASAQKDCKYYVDAYWDLERDMRAAANYDDADTVRERCGAELVRQMAAASPILLAGPPWERAALRRGEKVQVVGLTAQRRFNGRAAVVLATLEDGRIKVKLADQQTLGVRRSNVRLAASTPPPPRGPMLGRLVAATASYYNALLRRPAGETAKADAAKADDSKKTD